MENKKILFITFDVSGYYNIILEELKLRYSDVDYYNTATISYKYKNIFEKIYSFFYKVTTGKKLKNFYKYNSLINEVKDNKYDITLVVRPDLFFDSQLESLRNASEYLVAYYHDSVNEIKRKKDVISFFDKIYSYEKADVAKYNLQFLPNFIYFNNYNLVNKNNSVSAFTVMSNDYRVSMIKKVAECLKRNKIKYDFYVLNKVDEETDLIHYFTKRKSNSEVMQHLKEATIIVDIHKYGVQDGLTFRVFESLGLKKKLITTNSDIKKYDFYNPNNIFVIDDRETIEIPTEFFTTNYEEIPESIYKKYTYQNWLTTILKQ